MKYCLDYMKSCTVLDEADEIIILGQGSNDMETITGYIEDHPEQRVIIDVGKDMDLFKKLANILIEQDEITYSLRIRSYEIEMDEVLQKYKDNDKVSYFFETFVRDWDMFNGFLELGVSDIYLVEQMCFQLDKVKDYLEKIEKKIQIRVFPNIAQSNWSKIDNLKKFFIRPEDLKDYEEYVDVLEFFGEQPRIDETLMIYKHKKEWHGMLNEIIIDLGSRMIDNRYIIGRFAERRIKCGKKCMYGGSCNMCETMYDLSNSIKTVKEKKIKILKEEIENGKRSREQENNSEKDNGNV